MGRQGGWEAVSWSPCLLLVLTFAHPQPRRSPTMEIKAADVMKLRDRTGVQMMKCKEALVAAGGDFDKALEHIMKTIKGAENRPDRVASEGRVGVYLDPAGASGGIVELRCESSPVAKNEMFVKLANDLAKQVAAKGESPA